MKVELRAIKVYDRLSEETTAFTAVIYADGKRVGDAKNDGHGGSTWVRLDRPASDRAVLAEMERLGNAYNGKTYCCRVDAVDGACPKCKREADVTMTAFDGAANQWVDVQIEIFLDARHAKRQKQKLDRADKRAASEFGKRGMLAFRYISGDSYYYVGLAEGTTEAELRAAYAKKHPDMADWTVIS